MTGSGTATIPTGTIGTGSNIADVAMQMDTEAFSIGNLIDEGVVTISDTGYVQSWDASAFEGILTEQGLSSAYQAAKVDDVLSQAVLPAAEAATPISGGAVLSVFIQHLADTNQKISELDYYIQDPEGYAAWKASLPENAPGLEGFINRLKASIGFEDFKNGFLSIFGSKIDKGLNVNSDEFMLEKALKYNVYGRGNIGTTGNPFIFASDYPIAYYVDGYRNYHFYTINLSDSSKVFYIYYGPTYSQFSYVGISRNQIGAPAGIGVQSINGGVQFDTFDEVSSYLSSFRNNELPPVYSPDVINQNGNLQGTAQQPTTLQDGQAIKPIGAQDYQQWADQAQQNTDTQNYDLNGNLFTQFANPFIGEADQQPDVVFPSPEYNTPTYESGAITPNQPTDPVRPELTPEQQEQALSGRVVGLQDIFPFCIPFDIVSFIKKVQTPGRSAPQFNWTYNSELFGYELSIDIDLSQFNGVASVLRILELILFIIGLAAATRSLIGAGG